MKVIETALPGVLILEPRVFGDERGFFMESWNAKAFADIGITASFVQDNHSRSAKNVLRGLHYQIQHPQGKLLRVLQGSVFDVVVDLRRSSPHFGKAISAELSSDNKRMIWVPEGFAHGFLVTSDTADVAYKVTDFWVPQFERSLLWSDPALGIGWPSSGKPVLSAKDESAALLLDAEVFS